MGNCKKHRKPGAKTPDWWNCSIKIHSNHSFGECNWTGPKTFWWVFMYVPVISASQRQGHTARKMQHEIVNRTVRHIKKNHLQSLCVPICFTNPHYGIYTISITQTNSIIPHLVSCKNWDFWLHLCVHKNVCCCNNICSNPYKQHFMCNYYRCQSDNIYRPGFGQL